MLISQAGHHPSPNSQLRSSDPPLTKSSYKGSKRMPNDNTNYLRDYLCSRHRTKQAILSRLNQEDRRRVILDEASVCKRLMASSWSEQPSTDKIASIDSTVSNIDHRLTVKSTIDRHETSKSIDHASIDHDMKASRFVSIAGKSSVHRRNCNDRSKVNDNDSLIDDTGRKREAASTRKNILRQKFPEIGAISKPFPKQWEGPKKSEFAKQLDKDTGHLYHKIFYYKFQRNLALHHKENDILKELKTNAKTMDKENLTIISRPESPGTEYAFGEKPRPKRKAPKVFGLVKIEEDDYGLFKNSKEEEPEDDYRPVYIDRYKNAETVAQYYQYQDMSRFKVLFDDPYKPPKSKDPALDDRELIQNLEIQNKQSMIQKELEEYGKVVTDVFMTENAKKKQAEKGLITNMVIDNIIEAMRGLDKTFQLESRMQGLYHTLEQISFFRMFKIREALETFARCKLFKYKKGTQFMFTKQSHVIIILRGNMMVNEPEPIETDDDGNIVPESLKVTRIKGGHYENMYFNLKDGDFINNNVLKYLEKNDRALGAPVVCIEECLTLLLANDDMTKDYLERVNRADFYNILDYVCKHQVFQNIGHINLTRISKQIIHFKYSVGEHIFNKNEISDGVYILIRGAASITYRDDFINPKDTKEKSVPTEMASPTKSPPKKQKK